MYLEIKDVKKSYGSDASYIQVLKGITTSLEKADVRYFRVRAALVNPRSLTA